MDSSRASPCAMDCPEAPARPSGRKPYKITRPREKWTEVEHERFVEAIERFGRDWKRIVEHVGTRSVSQVRSHGQKHFLKLEKAGKTDLVPPMKARGKKDAMMEMSSSALPCSMGHVSASPPYGVSPQLRVRASLDNISATADSGESSHFHHPPSARSRLSEAESSAGMDVPGASPCVFALVAAPPLLMVHGAAPAYATLPVATSSGFAAVQPAAAFPPAQTPEFLPIPGAAPTYNPPRGGARDYAQVQGLIPGYGPARAGGVEVASLQGPSAGFTPIQRATPAYALVSGRGAGAAALPVAPVIVAAHLPPAAANQGPAIVLPGVPGGTRPVQGAALPQGSARTMTSVTAEGLKRCPPPQKTGYCMPPSGSEVMPGQAILRGSGAMPGPMLSGSGVMPGPMLQHSMGLPRPLPGLGVLPTPTLQNAGCSGLPVAEALSGMELGHGSVGRVAPTNWQVPAMPTGSSKARLVPGSSASAVGGCFPLANGVQGLMPRACASDGPVVVFSPFNEVEDPGPVCRVEPCPMQDPNGFFGMDRPAGAPFHPMQPPCSAAPMFFPGNGARDLNNFGQREDCDVGAERMFPQEAPGTGPPDFSQSENLQMAAQDIFPPASRPSLSDFTQGDDEMPAQDFFPGEVPSPPSAATEFDRFSMPDFCGMDGRHAQDHARIRFDHVRPVSRGGARGSLDSYLGDAPGGAGNLCFRPDARPAISGCASAPAGACHPMPQGWLPAGVSSGGMGMTAPGWPSSQGFGPMAGRAQCGSSCTSMDIPIQPLRMDCENRASNKIQASLPWDPSWDMENDKSQLQIPPLMHPGSMHLSAGPSVPMFHMHPSVSQSPMDPCLQPGQRRVYCAPPGGPHGAPHGGPHAGRRMPLEMLRMPSHQLVRSASVGHTDTKDDADIFREMASALC